MNCKQYRAGVEEADFAAAQREAASGSHADGCAACRDFRDERAVLRELVAGLARVDAPPDFEFRLRARIAAADAAPSRPWARVLMPRAAWLAAAGCLALAAALALQTLNPLTPGARDAASQPAASQPPAAQTAMNTAPAAGAEVEPLEAVGDSADETANVESNAESKTNAELSASAGVPNGAVVLPRRWRGAVAATDVVRSQQRRNAAATSAQPFVDVAATSTEPATPMETNTLSMKGSPVIVSSPLPLPVSADERPLQVLFKDTRGGSRVVSVDPVAFGSNEPAARPTNVNFTKAKKQGVW